MSSLGKRVRMGTTLAVAAAGLLWLHPLCRPGVLSLCVVTLLALLSIWELDRMGSLAGRGLVWSLGLPAALSCAGLVYLIVRGKAFGATLELAGLYVIAGVFASTPDWSLRGRSAAGIVHGYQGTPRARTASLLALWLLPPLFSIVLVDREFGTRGLVALVVLAKAGDNAGYFVGRAFGKRHPFPNVSPGKTVAGCVASLLAGTLVGAALLPATLGAWTCPQIALGALLGALVNLAAQAGDLSESWVKRRAGVKDSSALLGPSGGVLDVIDSLLLAAPVALVSWSLAYGAST